MDMIKAMSDARKLLQRNIIDDYQSRRKVINFMVYKDTKEVEYLYED